MAIQGEPNGQIGIYIKSDGKMVSTLNNQIQTLIIGYNIILPLDGRFHHVQCRRLQGKIVVQHHVIIRLVFDPGGLLPNSRSRFTQTQENDVC